MSNQDDIDAMFGGGGATMSSAPELSAIYDTVVEVSVVLGTSTIRVRDLLKLGRGAIVELDRKIDDLSDIIVSGRTVGRGEVTIVEDKIAVTFREFTRVNG
ncbi:MULTISPECIES: flagellar motor switch protein FliN [Nitrospirillum]|nr:flagellar motor switch protein FliN [Nitrospirillum amazonense]MDG3441347.1 flagellar motor switch protein FliN [Nitrospirillum amazonense]MEC4591279.1 flagellar motor switch protein FliN [Nitrospirillum amazonense]TWB30732.1 flagellar motor switch protein FliN/FliY [Nitrospirillum amazonense]TWB34865.1 flagellar motor switch protein FliN/FliY [Nitrospirillum amazonense]TWB80164.1 flagellar motor switch protein FliN/FliY [Nitrospirillum amazonense]